MQDDLERRLNAAMGGQRLPEGAGHGVKVLYRCDRCGHPHLQDGTRHVPRLSAEELGALAVELGAELGALPYATCDICAALHSGGTWELDEYNGGVGYGLSYEGLEPPGAHVLVTVVDLQRMQRLGGPRVGVITNHARCRAVLAWLQKLQWPAQSHPIGAVDAAEMAASNPPGHGAPGTAHLVWRGARWLASCPPLSASVGHRPAPVTAVIVVAQALPPDDPYSLMVTIRTVRALARRVLDGRIAGEETPPPSL